MMAKKIQVLAKIKKFDDSLVVKHLDKAKDDEYEVVLKGGISGMVGYLQGDG